MTSRPAQTRQKFRLARGAPQLALEGLLVKEGAFAGILPGFEPELRYIVATGGEPPGEIVDLRAPCGEVIQAAATGLSQRIARFDDPATPYAYEIRAIFREKAENDPYAHLARVKEWSAGERRAGRQAMTERSAEELLEAAERKQRAASDPAVSAWVRANAGTGKTHVLVQRILRLLLSGADPRSILCLTFTKNAAAEMETRVLARLGEWATADEEALSGEPGEAARPAAGPCGTGRCPLPLCRRDRCARAVFPS